MKIQRSNPQAEKMKSTLFFAGILGIIIIILWIGVSVYNAFNQYQPDAQIESLLKPLNTTLDIEALHTYRDSRVDPPREFQILVIKKDGIQEDSYLLNPFTGTSTQSVPPAESITPLDEAVIAE